MRICTPRLLILTLAAFLLPSLSLTQETSEVTFTIRFANGANRFQVGEIIPLELSFQASTKDAYDVEVADYSHSFQIMEHYHATPEGRDPFRSQHSEAVLGSNAVGKRLLTRDSALFYADLNEWVALDNPGHYSLYVTSSRVTRRAPKGDDTIEVRSNHLEFDVVAADPVWQQQTLATALKILGTQSSTPEERNAATRALRFLDTPASIHALVTQLGTQTPDNSWKLVGGLEGSRLQKVVVSELEQQLADPAIAVSSAYFFALSKLAFQLDHGPVPQRPTRGVEEQKKWREQIKVRQKELLEFEEKLYDKIDASLPSKLPAAKGQTVMTLLRRPSSSSNDNEQKENLTLQLTASSFLTFSQREQWEALYDSNSWIHIKSPAMLGPLKQITQMSDHPPFRPDESLRDIALLRLYELNPAEAKPIFLQEIRAPHLTIGGFESRAKTLGRLPDSTLPEFDELFATRLADKNSPTRDFDAMLIGRYATKTVLHRIRAIYESSMKGWSCEGEDGLLSYFLRTDPDYGVKKVSNSVSSLLSCQIDNSLAMVKKLGRWREVQPTFIASLNDSDPMIANSVTRRLGLYGDADAKTALWNRLRSFHEQWADRENELALRPNMPNDTKRAADLHHGLVYALATAQEWLLTEKELADLEKLSFGRERESVRRWRVGSKYVSANISVTEFVIFAKINQYAAWDLDSIKAKLAQFPNGHKLYLWTGGPPDLVNPVQAAILQFASEHSFEIMRPEPKK